MWQRAENFTGAVQIWAWVSDGKYTLLGRVDSATVYHHVVPTILSSCLILTPFRTSSFLYKNCFVVLHMTISVDVLQCVLICRSRVQCVNNVAWKLVIATENTGRKVICHLSSSHRILAILLC